MYEDYLAHHGIMGMKWGVRRYQNKDGTYTAKGKKRRNEKRPTYNVSPRKLKKNMKYMDDKELQRSINRVNMQRQVKSFNPSIASRGEKALKRYTAIAGTAVAAVLATKKLAGLNPSLTRKGGDWVRRTAAKGVLALPLNARKTMAAMAIGAQMFDKIHD